MNIKAQVLVAAAVAACCVTVVQAQENTFKIGAIRYTTNSKTSGIQGIGVPAGADAETDDATTLLLTYERAITPNFGVELVIGIPPKITAKATGSVAFLGDEILTARIVAPTVLFNYHFGAPGDTWRPYVGAGINYTRFVDIESKLAPDVQMKDTVGLAAQLGVDYALSRDWGVFASVAAVQSKSKLVAAGTTVLSTTIDFRPITYSIGASYRF